MPTARQRTLPRSYCTSIKRNKKPWTRRTRRTPKRVNAHLVRTDDRTKDFMLEGFVDNAVEQLGQLLEENPAFRILVGLIVADIITGTLASIVKKELSS